MGTDRSVVSESRLDAALSLVADRQRRRVIRRLRTDSDGETTFEELVDDLHDADATESLPADTDREGLEIRLIHSHLPKLADHGLIEHRRDEGVIRYRPDERVEAVLDALPTEHEPTPYGT